MEQTSDMLKLAAEHLLVVELLRRGVLASRVSQKSDSVDIVANSEAGPVCTLRVLAKQGPVARGGWRPEARHLKGFGGGQFFALVDFGQKASDRPLIYLVPTKTVERVLDVVRFGRPVKPGVRRWLRPDFSRGATDLECPYPLGWLYPYLNAWDSLFSRPSRRS